MHNKVYSAYPAGYATYTNRSIKKKKMNSEILDDEFLNEEKIKGIQIVNWIPIIILWGGIGYCGINGLLSEIKVIAAIILLILSTGITYFNYELGVKITLGTILIGTINLVDFFPVKYFITFGIKTFEIGFEFLLFGIGIIHYVTNREELSKFLKELINREVSKEELESDQRSKIDGFKRRFSNNQIRELEMIVNNDKLLPEAIKAAKELIEEKKKTEYNNA